jgi:hypothetical protein
MGFAFINLSRRSWVSKDLGKKKSLLLVGH